MQSIEKVSPANTEHNKAENTLIKHRFWRLLGLASNKLNLSQWSYFK
jgi:hypothetical protein